MTAPRLDEYQNDLKPELELNQNQRGFAKYKRALWVKFCFDPILF